MNDKLNNALNFLRDKYGVPAGGIVKGPEYFQLRYPDGKSVNLLPWRVERRFVELKKLIDSKTLEDVSTFRFANFQPAGNMKKIIASELDLAAFLSGSQVKSLFASGNSNAACNIIFRLENGMSGCIECGCKLPANADCIDRHEIIARRGVASDRVVDTQVPQNSIYTYTSEKMKTFTDVDMELFGLSNDEIWIVRAAFAVLGKPGLAAEWNPASEKILRQAAAAIKSDETRQPVRF